MYIKNLKKYKHLTKKVLLQNIYHYNDIDCKSSVLIVISGTRHHYIKRQVGKDQQKFPRKICTIFMTVTEAQHCILYNMRTLKKHFFYKENTKF